MKFKEDMLAVEESAKAYQETEQSVKVLENRIACFRQELDHLEEVTRKEQLELETKSKDCDAMMARILYEKLSMEIHSLTDDLNIHTDNRDVIQDEMDELQDAIQSIEKTVHLYECAKQQGVIDEQTKEYDLLTHKIDVSRKNERELEPERRQIGGYLKQYFEKCLEDIKLVLEEKNEGYREVEQQWQKQKEKEDGL